MGCGCGANQTTTQEAPLMVQASTSGECTYTIEQVNSWLPKVQCAKDNAYYLQFGLTEYNVNLYIGIILSTQNYVAHNGTVCYFYNELSEVENFVINLTNKGLCLSN
jgi:hypothetical protein